jgi:hypothetical protein
MSGFQGRRLDYVKVEGLGWNVRRNTAGVVSMPTHGRRDRMGESEWIGSGYSEAQSLVVVTGHA